MLTEQHAKIRKVGYYAYITEIFEAHIRCLKTSETKAMWLLFAFLGMHVKTSIKNMFLIPLCIQNVSMCTSSAFLLTKEHKRRRYGEWQPQSPFTLIATLFWDTIKVNGDWGCHSAWHLLLCSTEERKSLGFETTRGVSKLWQTYHLWVNYPFNLKINYMYSSQRCWQISHSLR